MHFQIDIEKLNRGDVQTIAKAITLVDSNQSQKYEFLKRLNPKKNSKIIGVTGPPGAGKSTLINAFTHTILEREPHAQIAILAVDPSSPFNFGALLGDRIRMQTLCLNPQVYIRSIASKGALGGLNPNIMDILMVLQSSKFDYIILETVGVGQSEVDIAGLADISMVVLVPEAGDLIQSMKAGLMEIADIFVINKSDRPDAQKMYQLLKTLVHEKDQEEDVPVLPVIASQNEGILQIYESLIKLTNQNHERKVWLYLQYLEKYISQKMLSSFNPQAYRQLVLDKIVQNQSVNIYQMGDLWIENFLKK